MNRKVIAYENYYKDFFDTLDKGTQEKVLYGLLLLKTQDKLPAKYVKFLKDGLYEMCIRDSFIGSHLCTRLINDGHEVICLDNFFTGSKDNIAHLMGNHHFEVVRHDVTYPYSAEVDEIYNLACPASPIHYQHDPLQTAKTSVMGAINMLGLAMRLDAKVLQASTSEVYGDQIVHPQPEYYCCLLYTSVCSYCVRGEKVSSIPVWHGRY